jgi:hypothetical protein
VRDAPTLDAARAAADRVVTTFARQYPAAVACFQDDLEALLAIHRVPVRHRIRVRTTNLCERSFVEERRRSKVIPRFTSEKAAMKLVFATLIRAADRWCRVSITDLERHQLKLRRAELGLAPPRPIRAPKQHDTEEQQHDQQATDLQTRQDLTPMVAASTHIPANLSRWARRSHFANSGKVQGWGRSEARLRALGSDACSAGLKSKCCQATASLSAR